MRPIAVSRRRLLAAAAGVTWGLSAIGVTGCGAASRTASTLARDDFDLARRAATEAADLADRLEAAGRRHRDLERFLSRLAERHREHVRAFTPDTEQPRTPPAGRVPASRDAALRALAVAERRAGSSTRRAALAATGGDLARALASAAACTAQHAQLLTDAAGDSGGGP